MAYASFKYLSDRERKRVEKKRQKREQERLRKYLLTLKEKTRVLHDKVYRAPNRASGNTKSIHPDVREQYLKQKRDEYFDRELDENPLPSLDDLTASAPPKIIKDYFKLNTRERVTNTEKTKKGQEEMSGPLRKALGNKCWPVTKQKIDPETVLRTKRRNKGGRKNKTRRKKRTRRRHKKRLKKKNRKKRTKRR